MNDDTTDSPFTDIRTRKDVALSVGWRTKSHPVSDGRWSLHAPNGRTYTNGIPVSLIEDVNFPGTYYQGAFRVYDTEDEAWLDLPQTIEEITDGWKAVSND